VGLTRRHWILLGILAVCLIAADVVLASVGQSRAFIVVADGLAAPASLVISMFALIISRSQALSSRRQVDYARDQTRYAGEQARLAALASAYAYRPVLLPVHDAVPVKIESSAEPQYPAQTAFTVPANAPVGGRFPR
jgi:hypothetical protein